MSFSFPANPTVGQTSQQNNRTYVWTGYVWNVSPSVAESYSLPIATTSSAGVVTIGSGIAVSNGTISVEASGLHPFLLMGG